MAFTIAVSGKGGVGKTTFAALVVKYLLRNKKTPVLAVDADPNSNLHDALGVEKGDTVADIRERISDEKTALARTGISKERLIQMEIQQCVRECDGFDLLTMGRPEGPGCYCYVNNLLRSHLGGLSSAYPFVVIDNEAGMEHISRRTNDNVDVLFVVTEPTVVGVKSAKNVFGLTENLPVEIRKKLLVLNRVPAAGVNAAIAEMLEENDMRPEARIGLDDGVAEFAATGRPVLELPDDNPTYRAVEDILNRIDFGTTQ